MKIQTIVSTLIFLLTFTSSSFARGAQKPKYGADATPLSASHEYVQTHPAKHFWEFIPFYTAQRDGAACSIATIAMLVNAARTGAGVKLTSDDPLISQNLLLKKVKIKAWKHWLTSGGHGVSLNEAGVAAEESLKTFGLKTSRVEVVHTDDLSDKTKTTLHQFLVESEKPNGPYLIANFVQGIYTGDANVGHFAPIGAYDAENKKVLILDPDREWYEPYWISEETFLKGMATLDISNLKHRGYVVINSPEPQ